MAYPWPGGPSRGFGGWSFPGDGMQPVSPEDGSEGGFNPRPPGYIEGPEDPQGNIKRAPVQETWQDEACTTWHPKTKSNQRFPKTLPGCPPPKEQMTARQRMDKAFVEDSLRMIDWGHVKADTAKLVREGEMSNELRESAKYMITGPIAHLAAGGDIPPTDYCKIRATMDKLAAVGEVMGDFLCWQSGFKKGAGKATEEFRINRGLVRRR
jgi:hypothetical protein